MPTFYLNLTDMSRGGNIWVMSKYGKKYSRKIEVRITEDMYTALGLYGYYHGLRRSNIIRAIINYFFKNTVNYNPEQDMKFKRPVNIGEYLDRF